MKPIKALLVALAVSVPMTGLAYVHDEARTSPFAWRGFSDIETVQADEVLQAGTVIPATLLTAITSDNLHGTVLAVVNKNVYDSVTGKNLLIPAGSRLIGDTESFNGNRINLGFQRVIFPNGHSILLQDMQAIDGIGQHGLKDRHTNHSWLKTRSVLTGAIFAGAITALAKDKSGEKERTTASEEAVRGGIANVLTSISQTATQNGTISPTGTIRNGFQFNIMLHSDVKIRPYEK